MKLNPQLKSELKEYITKRLHDQTTYVEVVSPYQLTQSELDDLKQNIPVLHHARLENTVDRSILAGVIIKFGSKMIDLSINGELQDIRQRILK